MLGGGDGPDRLLPVRPRVARPAPRQDGGPARGAAAVAPRRHRGVRRGRPARAAGHRAAVDRVLGRQRADPRHRARVLDVEHRPRSAEQADLEAGRVTATQPPAGRAVGAAGLHHPPVPGRQRRRAERGERRHRHRGRRPDRTAAPDDGRPARRGRQAWRVLSHRVRLRRALGRTHRAHRPVRRPGGLDLRVRRLPAAGQGGLPGHRPARGPQPGAVVILGRRPDVRRRHHHVPHRPGDVVATSPVGRRAPRRAPRPHADPRHSAACRAAGRARRLPTPVRNLAGRGARPRPAGAAPRSRRWPPGSTPSDQPHRSSQQFKEIIMFTYHRPDRDARSAASRHTGPILPLVRRCHRAPRGDGRSHRLRFQQRHRQQRQRHASRRSSTSPSTATASPRTATASRCSTASPSS